VAHPYWEWCGNCHQKLSLLCSCLCHLPTVHSLLRLFHVHVLWWSMFRLPQNYDLTPWMLS
jgi:hypothetical protein